jgi:hypothetical protein
VDRSFALQFCRQLFFTVRCNRFRNRIRVRPEVIGSIPETIGIKPFASLLSTVIRCTIERLCIQFAEDGNLRNAIGCV